MEKFTITSLILFITCASFGQSIEQQVIGSSGTPISNGSNSLSLTIGESLVSNISSTNNEVKQGFWNSSSIITLSTEDFTIANLDVKIFPNPVVNEFTIKFNETTSLDYQISVYDINGKQQAIVSINNGETSKRINIENMASGVYLVNIAPKNSNNTITYRIIKK